MEELDTKKYAGIDLGKTSVQFSIYREGQEEMSEESFPIAKEQRNMFGKERTFRRSAVWWKSI